MSDMVSEYALVQMLPWFIPLTCRYSTYKHILVLTIHHPSISQAHVLYMGSICSPVRSAVLRPCCLSLTATGDTHSASRGDGRTTARQNKEKEQGHAHVQLIYR